MNFNKAANVLLVMLAAGMLMISQGCSSGEEPASKASSSPTEAYKKLFAAVKKGKTDEIKKSMSKATLSFAQGVSAQQGKTIDELLKNGFTRTTMSEDMPQMRDERIKENFGAVEVFSEKDGKWEDLPFILEEGEWKFAVGNLFNGTWKRPGVSRSMRERIDANTIAPANTSPIGNGNTNPTLGNGSTVPIIPKQVPNPNAPPGNRK